jgi:hypothetical protein
MKLSSGDTWRARTAFLPEFADFSSAETTSMSGELDPRVRELCSQIQGETDQARMLKLITELNSILQQPTGRRWRDDEMIAAD